MTSSVAGTYFTTWNYDASPGDFELGPIVVIGTNSVAVDGVTLNQAIVTSNSVAWISTSGNPSSGSIQLAWSEQLQAMTFSGVYWLAGEEQPAATNLYGFDTQPVSDLATWNNTYQCYQLINGSYEPAGDLTVSSPAVTYEGNQIVNPIYTGLNYEGTDTNELAWYVTDGNAGNVAISFFNSPTQAGVLLFNGCIWPPGATRLVGGVGSPAAADNFLGTTEESQNNDADNNHIHEVEQEAGEAHQAQVGGVAAVTAAALVAAAAAGAFAAADVFNAKAAQNVTNVQDDENAEGDDDAVDDLENVAEDIEDEAVGATARLGNDVTRRSSRKPTGLSARQLLDLRNEK